MSAIFTGGITRIYIGALLFATHFLLISCGKVAPSLEPEIDEVGDEMQVQQTSPTVQREPFQITLAGVDALPITVSQKMAILEAKFKWESVIVEGLPDVSYATKSMPDGVSRIDDLYINVRWVESEDDNTLGRAYMNAVRQDGSDLPYWGTAIIYDNMTSYSDGHWTHLMMHEIGHILGFDVWLFELKKLREKTNGTWYFNGEHAVNAYRDILYNHMREKLAFAIPGLRVPMMEQGSHWKYPEMRWDTMHPYVANQSVLTKVTIGAIADLGYIVDMEQAVSPPFWLTKPTLGPRFMCDGNHIRIVSERGQ